MYERKVKKVFLNLNQRQCDGDFWRVNASTCPHKTPIKLFIDVTNEEEEKKTGKFQHWEGASNISWENKTVIKVNLLPAVNKA